MPGVAGTGAPVRLEFMAPGGAGTGRLLPTGNAADMLEVAGHGPIEASLVDAANPCVFVAASDLGLSGTEMPADLDAREDVMAWLQAIRRAAAQAMCLPELPNIPFVGIVAPPRDATLLSGAPVRASDGDLTGRMVSMGNIHRALPLTGTLCMTVAARIEGSVVHRVARSGGESAGELRIIQPSGIIACAACVTRQDGEWYAEFASVIRTQRRLFDGSVYVPAAALQ